MTIGLIPCAGHAVRMHGLPKWLLPVGDSYLLAILVNRMVAAGVKHVYIGANSDNYDLVSKYAPDGCTVYLCNTVTMSDTILRARKYAGDDDVLFAMPDTWFESTQWPTPLIVGSLLGRELGTGFLVSLSLFETNPDQRHKLGMVELGGSGSVARIVDKPPVTDLTYAWGAIFWSPAFWEYIHASDSTIGYAVQRAIDNGKRVGAGIHLGRYYDCGTSDEYFKLIRDTEVEHATA